MLMGNSLTINGIRFFSILLDTPSGPNDDLLERDNSVLWTSFLLLLLLLNQRVHLVLFFVVSKNLVAF